MRLKLTTITPVHIRGESELNDFNSFINSDSEIVKFDLEGYLDENPDKLDEFLAYVESSRGLARLEEFIDKGDEKIYDYILYKVKVDGFLINDIRKLIKAGRSISIAEHIKTAHGGVYIPGSSIKGSVRTALAHLTFKENPELWGNLFDNNDTTNNLSRKLENMIFKCEYNEKNALDLMSFIQISDTSTMRPDYSIIAGAVKAVKTERNSLRVPGNLRSPMMMELLVPNRPFDFEVRVDTARIKNLWEKGSGNMEIREKIERLFGVDPEGMDDGELEEQVVGRIFTALRSRANALLGLIDSRYSKLPSNIKLHKWCLGVLKQDFKSRVKYYCDSCKMSGIPQNEATSLELIKRYIQELSTISKSPEKVLMRLGWGSGFHAMTLAREMPEACLNRIKSQKLRNTLKKAKSVSYPKTVRLYLEGGIPAGELGWVTIEIAGTAER